MLFPALKALIAKMPLNGQRMHDLLLAAILALESVRQIATTEAQYRALMLMIERAQERTENLLQHCRWAIFADLVDSTYLNLQKKEGKTI